MGVISPLVQTYSTVTPYITKAEFLSTPTALEVTDLLPGGTSAQQDRALADAISRASNWADRMVNQVLAATLDRERGRYRINRHGYVSVPLKFRPLLEVQAISVGTRPSGMIALTDFSDVDPGEYGIVGIPVSRYVVGAKPLVDVTYVNGWPNTATSSANDAADTSIEVEVPLGIYPGSGLTIYDGATTEQIYVDISYTPGVAILPLTSPLANAHSSGVSVSSLPPRVKMAVVLLTAVLIQTRGGDAIILDAMENPERSSGMGGASASNIDLARDMLRNELERVK